ncbi:helix-turn-helix domain-containing protein [Engelhardtia mirabilis]|uniref:Divergent AAA domain protein n=1 Tax=Engelhardtia mirabilis TaxID=2528011 RepID=A0A518BG08_9BACT|nr:Divergent AAA domain protein [Planctomycetes bacterium Pla133]QDV00243.1 Divergent AAA domain protein [Planctomycetes bacterium Pla86]
MDLDLDDLRALIAAGEGSKVEFKRGLPRAPKVARTLAAFANTRGGHFLVGVEDRGGVPGAPHPPDTARELRDIAAHFVRPALRPTVQILELDGRPVVVASVPLSDRRPHEVDREDGTVEIPVRLGSSTRAARGAALEALRRGRSPSGTAGLDALERAVLEWVARQGDAGTDSQGRCTPQAYAKSRNIGTVRARRAFVKLERAGHLIGHGAGSQRFYSRP